MAIISTITITIIYFLMLLCVIIIHIYTKKLFKEYYDLRKHPERLKEAADLAFGAPVDSFEDVTIIAYLRSPIPELGNVGYACDFSRYEDLNVIGINCFDERINNDDEDNISIYPHQNVYKYKDGTTLWN